MFRLSFLLLLTACAGGVRETGVLDTEDTEEADVDTDTDADSDTDADTDADADTDTDTDGDTDTDTGTIEECRFAVDVCSGSSCFYDVAPEVVTLSGAVTYDGQTIPDTYGSSYDEWVLQLVETTSKLTYAYPLDGGATSYAVDVYPGTYDVYFRLAYDGVISGASDELVLLRRALPVTSDTSYAVAPVVRTLSGAATYNAATIPDTYGSSYAEWVLHLEETSSHLVYTYDVHGGSSTYAVDVYPGTYDVYFRLKYDGVIVGASDDLVLLRTNLVIAGDTTYAVAPRTVSLSGGVTYDGAMIPDTYGSSYDEWVLQLEETTSHLVYTYDLDGGSSTYAVDVYPGTYDVYFRLKYDGVVAGAPDDLVLLRRSLPIAAPTSYTVAPAVHTLSGPVTYNGSAIPDTYGSSYDEWVLELRETSSHLSYTYDLDGGASTYAVDAFPGTYDVYFRLKYDGVVSGAPVDPTLLRTNLVITGPTTYAVAPRTVTLSGVVSYDGAPIPDTYGSSYDEWVLQLMETTSHITYSYDLDGGSSSYAVGVYPGTYDVYFRLKYDGVIEGATDDLVLLREDLAVAAATTYDVRPLVYGLSGAVTYDGAMIPDTHGSSYDEWVLQLLNVDSGLIYTYDLDGGTSSYAVDVYPGMYDVYFRLKYDSVIPGAPDDLVLLDTCVGMGG